MPRLTALLAPLLLLAACQSAHDGASAEDETARETLTPESATLGEEPATSEIEVDDTLCNADPVQMLIGQPASDEIIAQAIKDSGAQVSRVLEPNEPATLDLNQNRLNIIIDGSTVIQSLHCG